MSTEPLYCTQLRSLLELFRPEYRTDENAVPQALAVLVRNASEDDGTDRQLDWYSIALVRVLAHNMMPGQVEDMPFDPFFIEELDVRFARDFPMLYRPNLVSRVLQESLGTDAGESGMSREEELILGLLTRVVLSCYMLENASVESDRDFDTELESFLDLAVEQLYYLRDNGQDFGGPIEFPPHPLYD